MKTLLYAADPTEGTQLAVALRGDGHQLILAADETAGKAALTDPSVNIVMLAPGKTNPDKLIGFIRDARVAHASSEMYIGMMAQGLSEDFLVRAYEAGLDADFTPAGRALLSARIRAAERVVGASIARAEVRRAKIEETSFASALLSGGAQEEAIQLVSNSNAWRSAPTALQVAASTFLTLAATMEDLPPDVGPLAHACQIVLSSPQHQLDIRIAIGLGAVSSRNLAIHMFGPEGEDLAEDMLGEVANIFMGVLKTAFGADGLAFTGGLPEHIGTELVLQPDVRHKRQEAFVLLVGDARMNVHLGVRVKGNLFVPLSGLREGMVAVKDIFNSRGVLLINAGTRLSANMIRKLEDVLMPKSMVEVVAP